MADFPSNKVKDIVTGRNPRLEKKNILLQVLVEGDLTLSMYRNDEIVRYFITKNEKIEQLMYRKYKLYRGSVFAVTNSYYKQQLLNLSNCKEINLDKVENLNYNAREITKIVTVINNCETSLYIDSIKTLNKEVSICLLIYQKLNNF